MCVYVCVERQRERERERKRLTGRYVQRRMNTVFVVKLFQKKYVFETGTLDECQIVTEVVFNEPFQPELGQDIQVTSGELCVVSTRHQSITAMGCYRNVSFEVRTTLFTIIIIIIIFCDYSMFCLR